jgi:hypothetical protein
MSEEGVGLSKEIGSMATIERLLIELDDDTRTRVLHWALERFKVKPADKLGNIFIQNEEPGNMLNGYKDLAEFFSAISPSTESDSALVVGYWFQYKEGEPEFDAQKINTELKNLGHQVSNITRAFESLKSLKPHLVVQTKKTGTAKQARKRYKLTNEGKRSVEAMFQNLEGNST